MATRGFFMSFEKVVECLKAVKVDMTHFSTWALLGFSYQWRWAWGEAYGAAVWGDRV